MLALVIFCVGLVLLATAALYAISLHRSIQEKLRPLQARLLPLAITFLIFGALLISWSLGAFDSTIDSLFMLMAVFYAITAFFAARLNFTLRSSYYGSIVLVLYVIALPLSALRLDISLGVISILSATLIFASSISLLRRITDHLAMMSIANMFGSAILLAALIVYTTTKNIPLAYFLVPIFFFVSALTLWVHVRQCSYELIIEKHEPSKIIVYSSVFFFTSIMIVFAFTLTIAFHEVGHAIAANFFGCSSTLFIYNIHTYPFTQSACMKENIELIYAAGVISTTLVGLLLMLMRPNIAKPLGYLITGLGFFFVYDDLIQLSSPKVVFSLFLFGTLVLTSFGIIRLVTYSYSHNIRHKHIKIRSVICTAIT
ncbi:MAG: hypothetical protein AABX51_00905 [Nanoarchaeota archaeon]